MVIPPLSPPLSPSVHGDTTDPRSHSHGGDRSRLSKNDDTCNDTTSIFDSLQLNTTFDSTTHLNNNNTNDNINKSFLATPDTPTVPHFDTPLELLKDLNNVNVDGIPTTGEYNNDNDIKIPLKTYRKTYRLKDDLANFVLKPTIFEIELCGMIGKGSSSYVLKSKLFSKYDTDHKLTTSIKIPSTVHKATFIERELRFFKLLKDYYVHWLANNDNNTEFPFINLLGVYYINKDKFNLLPRETEVPSLVLENLQMDLSEYIVNKKRLQRAGSHTNLVIGKMNFWKLATTLITSLNMLEEMQCVHCDFKPQNILLNVEEDSNDNNDGEITTYKLIDFTSSGVIKEVQSSSQFPELTMQYSHPDLIAQRIRPSIQTDLYSIGLVLLFGAIGNSPYDKIDNKTHLLSLIMDKQYSVLDLLSPDDLSILTSEDNCKEYGLIQRILSQGATLAQVNSYLNGIYI